MCPYRCENPSYPPVSRLIMRAIRELKAKCTKCSRILALGDLDPHTKSCMKPKCAALDCNVTEEEMKEIYKVN